MSRAALRTCDALRSTSPINGKDSDARCSRSRKSSRAQSATRVESSVAPDAVPFYSKCGYRFVAAEEAGAAHPQMYKDLRP